jgi:hypothetical protein
MEHICEVARSNPAGGLAARVGMQGGTNPLAKVVKHNDHPKPLRLDQDRRRNLQ